MTLMRTDICYHAILDRPNLQAPCVQLCISWLLPIEYPGELVFAVNSQSGLTAIHTQRLFTLGVFGGFCFLPFRAYDRTSHSGLLTADHRAFPGRRSVTGLPALLI